MKPFLNLSDRIEFQSVFSGDAILVKDESEIIEDGFIERKDWYKYYLIYHNTVRQLDLYMEEKTLFIQVPHIYFTGAYQSPNFDEEETSWVFAAVLSAYGDYIGEGNFEVGEVAVIVQGTEYENCKKYKVMIDQLIEALRDEYTRWPYRDLIESEIVWHRGYQWKGFSVSDD